MSVVALAVAGVVLWAAVLVLQEGKGTGQLSGRQRFSVGRVDRLSAEIADRGPFLVADASPNRRRDIYVQWLGETPEVGWLAFSALAPGQTDRECFLVWRRPSSMFEDPCTGETFGPKGDGLEQLPVEVDDGRLYVDLE